MIYITYNKSLLVRYLLEYPSVVLRAGLISRVEDIVPGGLLFRPVVFAVLRAAGALGSIQIWG